MTTVGYDVTMNGVRVADLKSRLSEYLRKVRRGRSITVLDRDTPIARIQPL
jgi:prevent-host-death family protein